MPSDSIDTRIVCQPDLLLALLDGQSVSDAEVGPDTRPLTILQSWVKRAQSG